MSPMAENEFVLNYAMNRWQLNFKKNVGPTSESIRACCPSCVEEWEKYYYSSVRPRAHIDGLGRLLYLHIIQDLPPEKRFHPDLLARITEDDCIRYMHDVVIRRTFNGYRKEHGHE